MLGRDDPLTFFNDRDDQILHDTIKAVEVIINTLVKI